MKQDESFAKYAVPSNKFYRPHIDHSQSLIRTHLLNTKFPDNRHTKKIIIIEAQAGQGKTTLVSQFLELTKTTSIWYQIGPEDSDPVLLLSFLLLNLNSHLPGFQSPKLLSILKAGGVGPLDLNRCANILLQDLDNHLKSKDLYLVFDDLHLIEYGTLTIKLLEHLVDTSPPRVHFIFMSRHPIEIRSKTVRNGAGVGYLNTGDLALNNQEIEALYTTVLKQEISKQDAIQIHRITGGWIMGILLASHPISGRSRYWLDNSTAVLSSSPRTGHMLDYFQEEIFGAIPEKLHKPFLKLSFLQEIPADLAAEIAEVDEVSQILSAMTRENYFLYSLDDQQQIFRFHHFFQEFLQQQARDLFSADDIAGIFRREAGYYLKHKLTEKALTCYKNAGDFRTMDIILKDQGMNLLAKNKITFLTLLQSLPEEILFQYNWLTLLTGLLRVDIAPQTTLPFFSRVRDKFFRTGEEDGELMALSQIIYYHFSISGQYTKGSEILPRTRELLEKNKDSLPIQVLIMAARNLAAGYCFFDGEMEKARFYIEKASLLATRHDIRNLIAATKFIQGYIELFSGNRAKYVREAEICFSLFNDPLVSESNRLTLWLKDLCYLSMVGDHQNFQIQQLALQKSIDQAVINRTIAAPCICIWGASNSFFLGQTKHALELLETALTVTSTASTDHMRSQLLQWQAFGLAITGYNGEAIKKIAESSRLRDNAGGLFYLAFHSIMAGAVYTRVKQYDQAIHFLEKGLAIAQTLPSTYLIICALFNLSHCRYESEGEDAAIDFLGTGLTLMKVNGYTHFWSAEPVMMTKLLTLAVERDVERSFAQAVARDRLHLGFSENWDPVPLLKFSVMDHFEVSLAGKILFRTRDLSYFQREMVGLLVTAKGQRIAQDKIQLELWPERSPENARKSFDTLLARLRKLIAPHLPTSIKDYLFIQKGILCLTNYEIDAVQFLANARIGLSHCNNGDWWQAHSAFQTAVSYWKGVMPEDTFHSEQILTFNDRLTRLLVEIGHTWASNLRESGRFTEAISILERILQINSLEESLTRLLYQLYYLNHNYLKAREILERYRKALLDAHYTEQEADSFLDEIIKSVTKNAGPTME